MAKIVTNISHRRISIPDMVEWVCSQYLPKVDTITIAYNTRLLDKLSTKDLELYGLTTKTQVPHCYNVFIKEGLGASLPSVICHELFHIIQMERGDLDYDFGENKYYWKGEEIKDIPYHSREWEIEAFRNTLLKTYKKSLRK